MDESTFESILAGLDDLTEDQRGALVAKALEQDGLFEDALARYKGRAWKYRHKDRMLHHQPYRLGGESAVVAENLPADDHALVARVVQAYRLASQTPLGPSDNIWLSQFSDTKRDDVALLESGDIEAARDMLRNPSSSMLFYGFDLIQEQTVAQNTHEAWIKWLHLLTYDTLLQTTRATGARRVEYPEAAIDYDDAPGMEELLEQLDERLGFRIDFPNIFAGETGIATSRGVVSYRAAQALYHVWRMKQVLAGAKATRILEIGAGLGRTAYYALKLGVEQYTIIDIPLTGVAQAYYLGRVLGERAVSLWGEQSYAPVRVLPPLAYQLLNEQFDLVVNIDSLPEMSEDTARGYIAGAARLTRRFLSINREFTSFTVESLYRAMPGVKAMRFPCWSRRGYVEELLEFPSVPRA
ncbi:MAG: putative sugar O-methyltransferase [Acidobacteriota bacterium]